VKENEKVYEKKQKVLKIN